MRSGLILITALAALATTTLLAAMASSGAARADEWCGYTTKDNAVIECGYTTVQGCETAVGKGGMCFVDPDNAFNVKHATPIITGKPATGRG
jgi:hypothetical protein